MRDVEAFDSSRRVLQAEGVLEGLLDGLGRWLQYAEALLEAVLGVGFDQIEHGPLLPPLGSVNFHFPASPLGKELFQQLAIFEFHRDVNERWNVRIVEIHLL